MYFTTSIILALTAAPALILAAAIPKASSSNIDIFPRNPVAEPPLLEGITIKSAKFGKRTVLQRDVGASLDIRFGASNIPAAAMKYARTDEFKPYVVARHNLFFDALQEREFVPMMMHY